ncbi:hypothetical protein [Vibrio maritimus]|uniref:hypothetical protein n=1 Tax=Vibrio maritimus TaxID=990268 RepID=UPI003AF26657
MFKGCHFPSDVIDYCLSPNRDEAATKAFLNKAIAQHGLTEKVAIEVELSLIITALLPRATFPDDNGKPNLNPKPKLNNGTMREDETCGQCDKLLIQRPKKPGNS